MKSIWFKKDSWLDTAASAAILSGLLNGLLILANWYALSSFGAAWGLKVKSVLSLITMVVSLAFLIALFQVWIPRKRRGAIDTMIYGISYMTVALICMGLARVTWNHGLGKLMKRSAPLIEAIEAYQEESGQAPAGLKDLVPTYLDEVPATGIKAFPAYSYQTAGTNEFLGTTWPALNDWVVYVGMVKRHRGQDVFIYFPVGNYPRFVGGYYYRRVKNWAYAEN